MPTDVGPVIAWCGEHNRLGRVVVTLFGDGNAVIATTFAGDPVCIIVPASAYSLLVAQLVMAMVPRPDPHKHL